MCWHALVCLHSTTTRTNIASRQTYPRNRSFLSRHSHTPCGLGSCLLLATGFCKSFTSLQRPLQIYTRPSANLPPASPQIIHEGETPIYMTLIVCRFKSFTRLQTRSCQLQRASQARQRARDGKTSYQP